MYIMGNFKFNFSKFQVGKQVYKIHLLLHCICNNKPMVGIINFHKLRIQFSQFQQISIFCKKLSTKPLVNYCVKHLS